MGYRDYWNYYKPARPIEVKGGIKAQSRSGGFGESWWAKRWIDVLESFHMGPRLGRGRSYARKGQVISINIEKGSITAAVQGSRPRPYHVEMKVKTLSQAVKKKLLKQIGESILFAVKLNAGEMPKELEETFLTAGLPLFPQKYGEIKTDCSCPDWSDPCKHIAAVCYLLAEEFDRDPFLIVKLRGLERDELLSAAGTPASLLLQNHAAFRDDSIIPLSSDTEVFWGAVEETLTFGNFGTSASSAPALTLRRLGKFPFWRGNENLIDVMDSVYRNASASALEMLAGRDKEESSSDDEHYKNRGKKPLRTGSVTRLNKIVKRKPKKSVITAEIIHPVETEKRKPGRPKRRNG